MYFYMAEKTGERVSGSIESDRIRTHKDYEEISKRIIDNCIIARGHGNWLITCLSMI